MVVLQKHGVDVKNERGERVEFQTVDQGEEWLRTFLFPRLRRANVQGAPRYGYTWAG